MIHLSVDQTKMSTNLSSDFYFYMIGLEQLSDHQKISLETYITTNRLPRTLTTFNLWLQINHLNLLQTLDQPCISAAQVEVQPQRTIRLDEASSSQTRNCLDRATSRKA
jgi:hypothetical protein